jgi:hypothetical protein
MLLPVAFLNISQVCGEDEQWFFIHKGERPQSEIFPIVTFGQPFKGCYTTYNHIARLCGEYVLDSTRCIISIFRYEGYRAAEKAGLTPEMNWLALEAFPNGELTDLGTQLIIPGFMLGLHLLCAPGVPSQTVISAIPEDRDDGGSFHRTIPSIPDGGASLTFPKPDRGVIHVSEFTKLGVLVGV